MGQSRLSTWLAATAVVAYACLMVYAIPPQPVSLPDNADFHADDRDWNFVDPGYTRLTDLYQMTSVPDAEAPSRIQLLKRRPQEFDR